MPNKLNRLLGANLQALRKKEQIKQETIAKKLNISVSYVSKIENGKVAITVVALVNYCKCIGLDIPEIIKIISDFS